MKTLKVMPVVLFLAILFSAPALRADDGIATGEFIVEPPTLHCAGFEWRVTGDDNRNASVSVSFRKKGETVWRVGLPLLRLGREKIVFMPRGRRYINYEVPVMFAGSIFDLEPGTAYECRFDLSDPDGVTGDATRTVIVTTRPVPEAYGDGRVLHVYPPGYEGEKQEPSYTGLMEAYYGPGQGFWGSAQVEPGDIILVHAGEYKADRWVYYEPNGIHFHGFYNLTKSGTPERPIVIRGAGDGEAVFDGAGAYRLFDVMYADYTYIEGLTIRNCDVGINAGIRFQHGSSGIVVRNCRFENVGCALNAQYIGSENFYIADNVILGRHDPGRLSGWTGNWEEYGERAGVDSFIGIDINGRGHAVCNNYIAYFHDAIDITEQAPPETSGLSMTPCSIDIYNNDMYNMSDDFIEADCGAHNIRVYRNRGINAGQHGLSAQPIYGGPAYFIRNVLYHVPAGGAFKYNIYPAGVVTYHNTLCSEWTTSPPFSNVHLRNNLFLGGDKEGRPILIVGTYTKYTTFDYDGYRYNRNSDIQFKWRSPGGTGPLNYTLKDGILAGSFSTIEEFSAATGREKHGIVVDYDIFVKAQKPDPDKPYLLYSYDDLDLRLRPDAVAVDAGEVLPNINDGYTGSAPDLGAYERGAEVPVYGPRTNLYNER